ncbi:MAG: hypothetical protein V4628_15485 [Pseudomonadota bacterium]
MATTATEIDTAAALQALAPGVLEEDEAAAERAESGSQRLLLQAKATLRSSSCKSIWRRLFRTAAAGRV